MARRTRIGCLLAVAVLAAACGHSPSAATPAGLSIVSLTAQVQNAADGGYTYLVDYAVRNDASTPTTIVRIDTAVAAKGTPVPKPLPRISMSGCRSQRRVSPP